MRKLIKKFRVNSKKLSLINFDASLRNNFKIVLRSNVFTLIVPILSVPILTRLFEPSAFGLFGFFIAVLTIAGSFSTGRFDWSIPNCRTSIAAASLFVLGLILLVTTSILSIFLLVFIKLSGQYNYLVTGFGWEIWLGPLMILLMGLRCLLEGWFVKSGELKNVAKANIIQSSTNAGMGLAAGMIGLGVSGLVLAYLISCIVGVITITVNAGNHFVMALKRVSSRSIAATFYRYFNQSAWSTQVSILNAVTQSAPIFLLGINYSAQELGYFVLMQRIVAGPLGVISSALGQSFWSFAAQRSIANDMSELKRTYRAITLRLFLASVPIIVICLFGPFFVGPILGESEWSGAGLVLAAMTPLIVGGFIFSPTNHLVVLDKQKLQLFIDALRMGLMVMGVMIAYLFSFGFTAAVLMLSIGSFLGNSIIYFIQVKEHNK